MKTILVLTDFSEASFHAAKYAARLTQQFRAEKLVLYHAYQSVKPASDAAAFGHSAQLLQEESLEQLKTLRPKLRELIYIDTIVRCRTENTELADSINEIALEENADLIVMGVTGKSKLEQALVGSNTNRIANESKYPVILVPSKAGISEIKSVVLASDITKEIGTTPVTQLKNILDATHAQLYVVNVNGNGKILPEHTPGNVASLHQSLAVYRPSFHYRDNSDITNGILEFAREQDASLIAVVPGDRGFLGNLFHTSVTHQLAHHTSTPMLVLREE